MKKREDIVGRKFGRLVVLRLTGRRERDPFWLCVCECGTKKEVSYHSLMRKRNNTKSCGCLRLENLNSITHGLSVGKDGRKTRLYLVWLALRQRCFNQKNKDYRRYGGRGIGVCSEWGDYKRFHVWAMLSGYEKGLTIERTDNDKGYCPENCKWGTRKAQARNTSRNRMITFNGKTMALVKWGEETGLGGSVIEARIDRYGWSIERALTKAKRKSPKRKNTTEELEP